MLTLTEYSMLGPSYLVLFLGGSPSLAISQYLQLYNSVRDRAGGGWKQLSRGKKVSSVNYTTFGVNSTSKPPLHLEVFLHNNSNISDFLVMICIGVAGK